MGRAMPQHKHTGKVQAAQARSPAVQNTIQTSHRQECLCHISMAKKLRYMSKITAIFVKSDNTHLSCTQPIANLLTACL
jgi:hypothetical protein